MSMPKLAAIVLSKWQRCLVRSLALPSLLAKGSTVWTPPQNPFHSLAECGTAGVLLLAAAAEARGPGRKLLCDWWDLVCWGGKVVDAVDDIGDKLTGTVSVINSAC